MRKIEKRDEPAELVEWRSANQAEPAGGGINFGYDSLRQSSVVATRLLDSLLAEQGGVCAYTGRRIDGSSAHVEHLTPQAHCERGQDVAYDNMVACWPQPNGPHGQFGAHAKRSWPSPAEAPNFVSPLSRGCEARFIFNQRGEINGAEPAAAETTKRLKLDDGLLVALRRAEIDSVLGATRNLSLKRARSRLRAIEAAETTLNEGGEVTLAPYCFAVKQALQKYIFGLEKIRQYGQRQ